MERQVFPSEPREGLSITEPETNGAPDPLPEQKPFGRSTYWENSDGSIRKEIVEKVDQIRRRQY